MTSRTPDPALPERRYEVRGRVQGVGFRWWTKTQALRLGITGSVRNCTDGSVEVTARGDEASLGTFGEMLRQGPPGASVDSVDETIAAGVTRSTFEIER